MPRYNVEHEGRWAVFSSIVDDFITPFMPKEQFYDWRRTEYRIHHLTSNPFNTQSLHESLVTIGIMHDMDRVIEIVLENNLNIDVKVIEKEVEKELADL